MTTTTCLHCTASTTNGLALCQRCQTTLTTALVNVAAYHTDVLRIQPGQRVKVRSTFVSTPPPSLEPGYDPISTAAAVVDISVDGWVRILLIDRPGAGPAPLGTTKRCAWLENHIPSIVTLEWAAELLRDMCRAERDLRGLLDKADTGWYAGKCGRDLVPERAHDGFACGCSCHHGEDCDVPEGCGDESTIPGVLCERGLYASPGNNWIRCPECGTTWDVEQRRESLLKEARDEIAPIRTIAKVLVGLMDTEVSEERLAKRLDKWVERDQLVSMGVRVIDNRPRRVYRVGDVWDTLTREQRLTRVEPC